jgi:hypothetical protein
MAATPTQSLIDELFTIELSMRCQYCDDCSHLTIECPGLRHDVPSVRAFKERHFTPPDQQRAFDERMVAAGQAKPCSCHVKAETPTCSRCDMPEHAGRPLFPVDYSSLTPQLICGDCCANGTPLAKQPVREPERINYHAWQTPAYDGVG